MSQGFTVHTINMPQAKLPAGMALMWRIIPDRDSVAAADVIALTDDIFDPTAGDLQKIATQLVERIYQQWLPFAAILELRYVDDSGAIQQLSAVQLQPGYTLAPWQQFILAQAATSRQSL